MKKSMITAAASLVFLFAGASFAQQGDVKPEMQQEMKQEQVQKQEQKQEQAQQKKQSAQTKRRCPQGQVYSKKQQKCVPRPARSGAKAPAAGDAPKAPATEAAPGTAR